MKRIIILTLLLTGFQLSKGQSFEITPFGGYMIPTHWDSYEGTLYFNGAPTYGGMLSVVGEYGVDFDFIYQRIDGTVEPSIYGYQINKFDMSQNFWMIGGTKNFRVNPKLSPFLSLNVGGVYMAPKDVDYYSYWFFAMGLDGGVKVYLNDRIGLRLQANLKMPIQGGGFSFYYGTGGGGSNVYLSSTMVDFGFSGGLIFRVGRVN